MAWFSPLNGPIKSWRQQRVWLVGASTGIGAALARELAGRGALVALSARSRDKLEAVAASCPGARVCPMDVTRAEDFTGVRDTLLAAWGGIDVVIFNAGTYRSERAWELTSEDIRTTLRTNLEGVLEGVRSVVPTFLAQGRGALVVVASVAGFGGLPRATVYGPSKAALINLAEALYLDLAPRGVGVFLVNPGFVATPLTARNTFPMPALISAEVAAAEILAGMAKGVFDIHFPKRFTRVVKALQWLPRRLYFPLIRRVTGL